MRKLIQPSEWCAVRCDDDDDDDGILKIITFSNIELKSLEALLN